MILASSGYFSRLSGGSRSWLNQKDSDLVLNLDYQPDFVRLGYDVKDNSNQQYPTVVSVYKNRKGLLSIYDLICKVGDFKKPMVGLHSVPTVDLSRYVIQEVNPQMGLILYHEQIVGKIMMRAGFANIVDRIEWLSNNGGVYQIDSYSIYGFLNRQTFLDDRTGLKIMEEYFDPQGNICLTVSFGEGVDNNNQMLALVDYIDWIGVGQYADLFSFVKAVVKHYFKDEELVVRLEDQAALTELKDYSKLALYCGVWLKTGLNCVSADNVFGVRDKEFGDEIKRYYPNQDYMNALGIKADEKHQLLTRIEIGRKPVAGWKKPVVFNAISAEGVYANQAAALDLVKAWELTIKIFGQAGKLTLFGSMPTEVLNAVKAYIDEHGLLGSVVIGNYQDSAVKLYENASIYLQTQFLKGGAYALNEAKNFGLHTIGYPTVDTKALDDKAFDFRSLAKLIAFYFEKYSVLK